jgi:uncharacterized protein YbjT (DUF2867 family)
MNVLIFGATGMVGQGVLRECLQAADVQRVTAIGRTATGIQHPRLRDLLVPDLMDYRNVEADCAASTRASSVCLPYEAARGA